MDQEDSETTRKQTMITALKAILVILTTGMLYLATSAIWTPVEDIPFIHSLLVYVAASCALGIIQIVKE